MLRKGTSSLSYFSIDFNFYKKMMLVVLSLLIAKVTPSPLSSLPTIPPLNSSPLWPVQTDTTPQKPLRSSPPQRVANRSIFRPATYCGRGGKLQQWSQQWGQRFCSWWQKRVIGEAKGFEIGGAIEVLEWCSYSKTSLFLVLALEEGT